MKYSDWKLLTKDEKQQVKFKHRPPVRIATLFSAVLLLLLFTFIYRVLKNRTLHVNRKPTTEEAFTIAKVFVKDRLKMPATASFPGKYQTAVADTAHNLYRFTSYVNTRDVASRQVKLSWQIALNYTGGDWSDKSSWTIKQLALSTAP